MTNLRMLEKTQGMPELTGEITRGFKGGVFIRENDSEPFELLENTNNNGSELVHVHFINSGVLTYLKKTDMPKWIHAKIS